MDAGRAESAGPADRRSAGLYEHAGRDLLAPARRELLRGDRGRVAGLLRRPRSVARTVYGAVLRRGDRIALQYWYWYRYDFWSGQYPLTDYVWQAHEGDWEVVTVVLTKAEKPLYAAYSQHSCGKRRAWASVPKTQKTHPLVYVALGTHANYYAAGAQPVDLRPQCYPALGATLLHAYFPAGVFDQTGRGARVRPPIVVVTATRPQWMQFPGTWGEANFFHGPDPVNTRVAGLAPLGPAFHALWRAPIATPLGWPSG